MASEKLVLIGICALVLLSPTLAQDRDCNFDDLFISNKLETLIRATVLAGDNTDTPSITVYRNHTVCLAVGRLMKKVSSISLVIEYTCTGNYNCPGGSQNSEKYTEQFDFGCNKKRWSLEQLSDFGVARERNTLANFETAIRRDCGACFRRYLSGSGSYVPFDQITHCVSKCVKE